VAPPAAPTIDAALDTTNEVVELTIGVPSGAATLYVERLDADDVATPVRGAYGVPTTPGTVEVVDYEAPLDEPVTYRASVENAGGERSTTASDGPVEITAAPDADPWLVDLVEPANTQRVVVEQLAELNVAVPAGVHYIIGRRAPIVTTDIAKAPAFELIFVTLDLAARDRARGALGTGYPVLLRTPSEQGVGSLYLAVISYVEQRPSRLALHEPRRFIVQGQQVDAPEVA
jgi:hypothetical protein